MEVISLSRRDGTGFRAQVESLDLYKSIGSSAIINKWKAICTQKDPDRLIHVEILFCGFNFVSKILSKSSAENKFGERGIDLKKVKGV